MQTRIGTSQQQRVLQTLLMDTFQVDYRSTEDLLLYVFEYYSKLYYYNEFNEIDGTWDEVFMDSSIMYMLGIVNFDLSVLTDQTLQTDDLTGNIRYCDEKVKQWKQDLFQLGEVDLSDKIASLLNDDLYNIQIKRLDPENQILDAPASGPKEKKNSKLFSTQLESSVLETDNIESLRNIYTKLIGYISRITQTYLQQTIYQKSDLRPDVSLLLAFLELYKNAQNSINTISKRHLDFYYGDVLKIQLAPGQESEAIVNFQLAPTKTSALVDEGTQLNAGKLFGSSTDILFKTTKAIIALDTALTSVQTLFFNKNKYIDVGTKSTLVSNINLSNLQLKSGNILAPDGSAAAIFGANAAEILNPEIKTYDIAEIGFLLSSPVLYLSEGRRQVIITITFNAEMAKTQLWHLLDEIQAQTHNNFDVVFEEVFEPAFLMSYTTATGWKSFSKYRPLYNREANSISLEVDLGPMDPAIDLFVDENQLSWPAFRVDLNPYAPTYAYSFLAGMKMEKVEIEASVAGMKDLSMYCSAGKLIPSKAFDLFGPIPQRYNYFMFGKAELFKKQITELDFDIRWSYVPPDYGGFDTYYRGYSSSFTNESFQVKPSVLSAGSWVPTDTKTAQPLLLFDTDPCTNPEGFPSVQLSWTKKLIVDNLSEYGITPDYTLTDPLLYSPQTQSGFFKFTLIEPPQAFGAQEYVNDYTEVARYNATHTSQLPYPNPPFVPNVSECSLSYKAYDVLSFDLALAGNNNGAVNMGEFKQITPFGLIDILYQKTISTDPCILPSYEQQGYLIISLQPVEFPAIINALFYLKSTGSQPAYHLPALVWEYQDGQSWFEMPNENILNDGTQNFVKSGIIEIELPEVDQLSGGVYRLRVSPKGNPELFPNLAGIYLNSVECICTTSDPNAIGQVVPAGSINALVGVNPNISAVNQAMDSQNGRVGEDEYYQRVRERLRHKQRAISVWDYEHLVLQQFPDIGIVKCTNLNEQFKQQANNIRLVVMSQYWTFENQKYLNLEELAAITSFVKDISNPFCNVVTMNPVAEMLLVNCLVTFDPEDAGGYYLNKLNSEIINYLSPVSNVNGGLMGIGKTVVPQMLTGYLEKLSYVRAIDKLYIEQIVYKGNAKYSLGVFANGDTIRCTTDWSILMPADQHNIYLSSNASDFKTKVGISSMEVGMDFILDPQPKPSIENDELPEAEATKQSDASPINAVLFINDNYLNDEQII